MELWPEIGSFLGLRLIGRLRTAPDELHVSAARTLADQPAAYRSLFNTAPDRKRGLSAEALGMPCSALLEIRALAQPSPFPVICLDSADGLAFDVEGADLCGAERCYCRLPDLTHAASVPPLYNSCHYRISGVIAEKRGCLDNETEHAPQISGSAALASYLMPYARRKVAACCACRRRPSIASKPAGQTVCSLGIEPPASQLPVGP